MTVANVAAFTLGYLACGFVAGVIFGRVCRGR